MGNDDTGDSPALDRAHHVVFRTGVQSAGSFIQNDNGRILGQHAGDFQALPLSAGQVFSVFGQHPVITAGAFQYIAMDLGVPRSYDDFKIGDRFVPHPDVVGNRVFKQRNILINHGYRAGKHASRDGRNRFSVVQDFSAPRLIQPRDQLGQRTFSASAGAYKSDPAAGLQGHGKIPDQRLRQAGITEGDMLQLHLSRQFGIVLVLPDRFILHVRVVGILHHILHALHTGAHFLDGLTSAYEGHRRAEEGPHIALKNGDHADGKIALHGVKNTEEQDDIICGCADKGWNDAEVGVHFFKLYVLGVHGGLIPRPLLEEAVFRPGSFDGFRHADSRHGGGSQLAFVPHLYPGQVDAAPAHILAQR